MRYRIVFAVFAILLSGLIPSATLGQAKRGKGGGLGPNAERLADQQGLDNVGPAFLEAYERAKELRRALQAKAAAGARDANIVVALDLFLQAGRQFEQLVKQRLEAQAAARARLDGSEPDLRRQIVKLRRDLDSALIAIEQMKATVPLVAKSATVRGSPVSNSEKEGNSLQSLFDGSPKGLTTKALANRIRRDRVNDWLQENVNGKGKVVQLQVPMHVVATRAMDGTYVISLRNNGFVGNVFGETWYVQEIGKNEAAQRNFQIPFGSNSARFVFEEVSAADAEKLTDSRTVTIQGKVKQATLAPQYQRPDEDEPPYYLRLTLEDVRVNGKAYMPRKMAAFSKEKGR